MSKSVLYAANTAIQSLLETETLVNVGNIVRKYGCNLGVSGGNLEIKGSGYYEITTNVTVTPSAAGTLVAQIYKDGVAIPGAEATLTAVANTDYAFVIPAIVRETCNCLSTITLGISGVAGIITNVSVMAEKV